jgi:ankyrin repeat protein
MSELLLRSAQQGRTEFVKRALDRGHAVDYAEAEDGITALAYAAEEGHVDTMHVLLERGASVDARDVNGVTPLMVATYGGHTDAMRLLIERGADVCAGDSEGATALHRAAFGGNPEPVTDLRLSQHPYSEQGHSKAVHLLINSGAEVNATDASGWTPLMMAMGAGEMEVVRLLLDAGANVNASDNDGRTAMHWARENGHYEVAELLLQAMEGASPS